MLQNAINSVLSQTQTNLEVIVVDDCSTDGTGDFVKSLPDERVRYFRNEKNSGLEYNRNFGLKHARGKYITWLDDDDYYTDYEFFEKAVKIFEEHESDEVPITMVYANANIMYTQTNKICTNNIGRPGRVKGLDYILCNGYQKPLSTFTAVFMADILRRAGLEGKIIFDTLVHEDAALEGDAWFMPDIIGVYRVHGQNMTAGGAGFSSKDPEREARVYASLDECIRQTQSIADVLRTRTDKKTADSFYICRMRNLLSYYAHARPGIKNNIKTCMCVLKGSGFMPKLWLNIPVRFVRYIFMKYMNKFFAGKH